jgi:flagellar protein FlgJ
VSAKFRAYGSDDEAFRDYARMLTASPRYAGVAAQAAVAPASAASASSFAQGLQRAGYATDPAYADKLSRVINATLRVQKASA